MQTCFFFEDLGEIGFEYFLNGFIVSLALPTRVMRTLKSDQDFDSPHKISAICTAFNAAPLRN